MGVSEGHGVNPVTNCIEHFHCDLGCDQSFGDGSDEWHGNGYGEGETCLWFETPGNGIGWGEHGLRNGNGRPDVPRCALL